jgi:hypothetical protein
MYACLLLVHGPRHTAVRFCTVLDFYVLPYISLAIMAGLCPVLIDHRCSLGVVIVVLDRG